MPPIVMLVEDDPDIRISLNILLRHEGYTVVTAVHGQDALDQLHHDVRPCVILLDLMMPVMDGWQFRQEQLRDPDLANIPVVLLSGSMHLAREATSLGTASFIEKPIDIDQFFETVRTYVTCSAR